MNDLDNIKSIAASLYKRNSIYDIEDLIQVGYIGLINAQKKNLDINETIKLEIEKFIALFAKEKNKKINLNRIIDRHKEYMPTEIKKATEIEKKVLQMKIDGFSRKEICKEYNLTKKEYYSVFMSVLGKLLNE